MTNSKCGEVTYCTQVGKRVYVLNCLYCSQICLQWEMFINHLEQEHENCLNLDPTLSQPETIKAPVKIEPPEVITDEETVTPPSKKQKMFEELLPTSVCDDPLDSDNSASEMGLESTIKIEEEESQTNLHLFGTEDNSSELTNKTDHDATVPNTSTNNPDDLSTNFITIRDLNKFKNELKEELKKTEIRLKNQIKEQPVLIRREFKRVLEEFKATQCFDLINSTTPRNKLIPRQPFSSVSDFLKFDTEIKNDEEKYCQLVLDFESQNAKDLSHYVRLNFKRFVTDEAAQHLCWKGTDKKKPVRELAITQALKAACYKKYDNDAVMYFERICIQHFQYAKVRHEKKLNYKSRVKPAVGEEN